MATEPRPWEVIRAAANKLAELAENATAGLWRCHDTRPGFGGGTTTVLAEQQPVDGEPMNVLVLPQVHLLDAEWITTLSPAAAEPLAAWLRDAAGAAEDHGVRLCSNEQKALDLARVILGESP